MITWQLLFLTHREYSRCISRKHLSDSSWSQWDAFVPNQTINMRALWPDSSDYGFTVEILTKRITGSSVW
jgi:hypothetical protein